MVVSHLNSDINYPEIKQVDKDDINHNSPLYQTEINSKQIIIALGTIKFSFVTKGILYVHVYLVQKNKVVAVLGVYEFLNKNYVALMDADDDLDVSQLGSPLIYKSGEAFLALQGKEVDEIVVEEEDEDEEEDEEDEDEEDEEDKEDEVGGIGQLLETEVDQFDEKPKQNWVQRFMKNSNYEVKDEGGGGDCLFKVIEAAYAADGKKLSVATQRKMLADEVTKDLFQNYREFYAMHLEEVKTSRKEFVKLKKQLEDLGKVYIKSKHNPTQAKKYRDEGKKIRGQLKIIRRESNAAKAIIADEFKFMKNIKNIEEFKKVIQTCDFWADTWAISTMERLLNIKLILLSSRDYNTNNLSNVLQCGQQNDTILEQKGVFTPSRYIITDYLGNHYKLISYKGKKIFTFRDLPYGLVLLIINTCMKGAGLYNLIPKFRDFKKSLKGEELFNKDIVFQFYSKSQDKPPGKGTGEKIPQSDIQKYNTLKKIKNWRQILSNFSAEGKILYDGLTWNTGEHLYHALKFKKGNPDFYKKFSLESGSDFSKDPRLAKAAGGKTGKYSKKVGEKRKQFVLRPRNIKADSDFFPNAAKHMKTVLEAKFKPSGLPHDVLKATGDAHLVHFRGRGGGTEDWNHLMEIRATLV